MSGNGSTALVEYSQQEIMQAFGDHADEVAPRADVKYLKFTKFGEYAAGKDGTPVALGTQMIALMREYQIGWIKWVNNRPVERSMGRLSDPRYHKKTRAQVEDGEDPSTWELNAKGERASPWRETCELPLLKVGTTEFFVFSTSSLGGRKACGELARAYKLHGKLDVFPVIGLQTSSYIHPIYKKIINPKFDVVGWKMADSVTSGETDFQASSENLMNDDIPF